MCGLSSYGLSSYDVSSYGLSSYGLGDREGRPHMCGSVVLSRVLQSAVDAGLWKQRLRAAVGEDYIRHNYIGLLRVS